MGSDAVTLLSERLRLVPLSVDAADEMVDVLGDPELYRFTGGVPPTRQQLESRYRAQVSGPSNGEEVWHNWIIRTADTDEAIGFVQATVAEASTDIAWVVGLRWQRSGFAREAALEMKAWLVQRGSQRFTAHIHPAHEASQRVAAAVGLHATTEVDENGEVIWVSV